MQGDEDIRDDGSEESEGEEDDDNDSFASVDDLEGDSSTCLRFRCLHAHVDDEGVAHMQELSKLVEKDPEFYKYLQENDAELLNFDPNAMDAASDEEAEEMDDDSEEAKTPVLTSTILKSWQKALLEASDYDTCSLSDVVVVLRVLPAGSVSPCTTEAVDSLSLCSAHERRGSSCCVVNR